MNIRKIESDLFVAIRRNDIEMVKHLLNDRRIFPKLQSEIYFLRVSCVPTVHSTGTDSRWIS
jgi:hypothetical protein